MFRNTIHWWLRPAVGVALLALSTACVDDAALGPDLHTDARAHFESASASRQLQELTTASALNAGLRVPDPGACTNLQIPGPAKIVLRVYATGAQIYSWSGTNWNFVAPDALLFADAGGHGQIGTHYAGPTWESVNGGRVYGTVVQRCTVDATTIPWLLLTAVPDGPGIFHRVAWIHRVNTTGGNAPSYPGTVAGEIARVPYTADYVFYRDR